MEREIQIEEARQRLALLLCDSPKAFDPYFADNIIDAVLGGMTDTDEEVLGYMVVACRPSSRTPGSVEFGSAGFIHDEIEPCLNHQAFCEMSAADNPEKYGGDVTYPIVRLTTVKRTADVT